MKRILGKCCIGTPKLQKKGCFVFNLIGLDISSISFRPEVTFRSGQTFRWRKVIERNQSKWIGIIEDYAVRITGNKAEIIGTTKDGSSEIGGDEFSVIFRKYLSSQDDQNLIRKSFPRDDYLSKATNQFAGLKILTQDPWECLISFVCSINKNIPAIVDAIERLSIRFGRKIDTPDGSFFSFPSAAELAKASKTDLLSCKVGFRWRFIQHISRQVALGNIDLQSLIGRSYEEGRRELIAELSGKTYGVGPKVADCVLLFSLHKLEAFPLDVWMLRCLREKYSELLSLDRILSGKSSLTLPRYETLHSVARSFFGPYCGYAQQYLYMKIRNDSYSK